MEHVDCILVGAGVVGLACARGLALAGREVIVLEANGAIGMETSSRNSEVIHSGIYYPQNSLKARTCVRGRDLLYEFCEQRVIGHRKLGKLIVATTVEELGELSVLLRRGKSNGVTDLELYTAKQVNNIEPEINCLGALWSPSTGIIDSHEFMLALHGDLENHGGMVVFNSPVLGGVVEKKKVVVHVGGEAPMEISCNLFVNAAGLSAQNICHSLAGFPKGHIPKQWLARGVYFSLSGKSPFKHLIYPAPEPGGLGVHATLDMGGYCRFGPDVEWIESINYEVEPNRADVFYKKIRKYWPSLKDGQLQPDYAGIRPKIAGPNFPTGDFILQGPSTHEAGPIVNLFGIESPGLTAALALAEDVVTLGGNV